MAVGARLFLEADMQAPEVHDFAGGEVCVYSARSPDKDGVNEDGIALLDWSREEGALVVADGLGGYASGARACAIALRCLEAAVERGRAAGAGLRDAILDGIESANEEVSGLGNGAATTLAIVEISGGLARSYHVGDSSILVAGQRGRVRLRTVAHSPVSYAVEAGLLAEDEAMHHADRHLISNIVGSPDMRIEVGTTLTLGRFDTVVLASDGLGDNLTVEEIVEQVRRGAIRDAGHALVEICRHRMLSPGEAEPSKLDDMTFVLFRQAVVNRTRPARR